MEFLDPSRNDAPQCPVGDGHKAAPGVPDARAMVHLLTSGTRIATPQGEAEVDGIVSGDFVTTRYDGPQRIEDVGFCAMPRLTLITEPRLTPVAIGAQAFGHGLPARPIWLHPLTRVAPDPQDAKSRRACDLVGDVGVTRIFPNGIIYVALRLSTEVELHVGGIWLGPQRDAPRCHMQANAQATERDSWQQVGQIAVRRVTAQGSCFCQRAAVCGSLSYRP